MSVEVAVIGKGGREQSLIYKLGQSSHVDRVLAIPGNPGSEDISRRIDKPVKNIPLSRDLVSDVMEIIDMYKPLLVVVGSEPWLAKGIGNVLEDEKIPAIAPTRKAAELETSKIFTRRLCQKLGVPQPEFEDFRHINDAISYIYEMNLNEGVIKADGLADGKGVIVCKTQEAMIEAIYTLKARFPEASSRFLVEERLDGAEISYIVLTDGTNFKVLPPARDYKREYDGDKGENTGSMGTQVPNSVVTECVARQIEQMILEPVLMGMNKHSQYKGILYLGVMLTAEGPKLIEINVRGGDTETQTQLSILDDDLYELFMQIVTGSLEKAPFSQTKTAAVTVVLAAPHYPRSGSTGVEIFGLDQINDPNIIVFHAGTKRDGSRIVTNGGRILNLVGVGDTLEDAREKAYKLIDSGVIYFDGMKYRKDIGKE